MWQGRGLGTASPRFFPACMTAGFFLNPRNIKMLSSSRRKLTFIVLNHSELFGISNSVSQLFLTLGKVLVKHTLSIWSTNDFIPAAFIPRQE